VTEALAGFVQPQSALRPTPRLGRVCSTKLFNPGDPVSVEAKLSFIEPGRIWAHSPSPSIAPDDQCIFGFAAESFGSMSFGIFYAKVGHGVDDGVTRPKFESSDPLVSSETAVVENSKKLCMLTEGDGP